MIAIENIVEQLEEIRLAIVPTRPAKSEEDRLNRIHDEMKRTGIELQSLTGSGINLRDVLREPVFIYQSTPTRN